MTALKPHLGPVEPVGPVNALKPTCKIHSLKSHLQMTSEPRLLHQSAQSAAEEELAPPERGLAVPRRRERLAAAEFAGDGTAVEVAVGEGQAAPGPE